MNLHLTPMAAAFSLCFLRANLVGLTFLWQVEHHFFSMCNTLFTNTKIFSIINYSYLNHQQ